MPDNVSIYIATDEGNLGCVKVGISCDPDRRAREIGGGGIKMVYAWVIAGDRNAAFRVEQCAHAILATSRHHLEWFSVTADAAAGVVRKAARLLEIDMVPEALPRVKARIARPVYEPARPWSEIVDGVCREFGITREELDQDCERFLASKEYGVGRNTLYREVHKAKGLKGSKQP